MERQWGSWQLTVWGWRDRAAVRLDCLVLRVGDGWWGQGCCLGLRQIPEMACGEGEPQRLVHPRCTVTVCRHGVGGAQSVPMGVDSSIGAQLLSSPPPLGVNLQPQLASVTFATNNPTLTTVALEKPLCVFDSSAALDGTYEIYLYVLVDLGKGSAAVGLHGKGLWPVCREEDRRQAARCSSSVSQLPRVPHCQAPVLLGASPGLCAAAPHASLPWRDVQASEERQPPSLSTYIVLGASCTLGLMFMTSLQDNCPITEQGIKGFMGAPSWKVSADLCGVSSPSPSPGFPS